MSLNFYKKMLEIGRLATIILILFFYMSHPTMHNNLFSQIRLVKPLNVEGRVL